jgi:hypothetical protein
LISGAGPILARAPVVAVLRGFAPVEPGEVEPVQDVA